MHEQFISPNWHVILIHYPLGLLTLGILIEVFSFLWPRSTVRTAGRWMVLLGALACLPALTVGIYAFRGIMTTSTEEDLRWQQLLASTSLSPEQWHFMVRHIWFAALGTAAALIGAITWLACSDEWRRRLYIPAFLLVIGGFALLSIGAWYSGESVYRQGTAVAAVKPPKNVAVEVALSKATTQAVEKGEEYEHERDETEAKVMYYVPPLQLHVTLAGVVVAFALGALGVTIRRWTREPVAPMLPNAEHVSRVLDVNEEITRRELGEASESPTTPAEAAEAFAPLYPARIWIGTLVFGVLAALAGLWLNADWKLQALIKPFRDATARSEDQRLFAHIIVGILIVVFAVILALLTRFARRQRGVTVIFCVLLLLAALAQLWLGIAMLYDTPSGSLLHFGA